MPDADLPRIESVSEILRSQTRALHEYCHQETGLKSLLDRQVTKDDWLEAYRQLGAGTVLAENWLFESAQATAAPDLIAMDRASYAYIEDFQRFGCHLPQLEIPFTKDVSVLLGGDWCLSGSRLGARVILQEAKARGFGDSLKGICKSAARQSPQLSVFEGSQAGLGAQGLTLEGLVAGAETVFRIFIDAAHPLTVRSE